MMNKNKKQANNRGYRNGASDARRGKQRKTPGTGISPAVGTIIGAILTAPCPPIGALLGWALSDDKATSSERKDYKKAYNKHKR